MATDSSYPVSVEGELDPALGRWLWLVKWLLVIPHLIVLLFLWAAFVVLTIVALFPILFTGRYPRVIFDFNVGVLRWTWRVSYYSYSALATDRYPPFSLSSRDYLANLEVEYPERLSRGLVLIKWWLEGGRGAGLVTLLALFGAVGLLFNGRYPRDIFELVLGLNRWDPQGCGVRRSDDRRVPAVPAGAVVRQGTTPRREP